MSEAPVSEAARGEAAGDPVAAAPVVEAKFRRLLPGDRLPSLRQACAGRPEYAFDSLAGRYLLYAFYLAGDHPGTAEVLEAVARRRQMFDDVHAAFIGVSVVGRDRGDRRMIDSLPGVRFAWDLDQSMSRACGATPLEGGQQAGLTVRRQWVLVDPSLHVLRIFPMNTTRPDEVLDYLAALPPPDRFGGVERPPPVLVLPNVLEPHLCARLIALYDAQGGAESGVHRDGDGVLDATFKRRRDLSIVDRALMDELNWRIARRVRPEIERVFFMACDYVERHIVGCYAAADGGHFAPHRDNSPGLTAHRRFAVSVNLNGDFQGGEVVFPEYSTRGVRAPPGWAVVFPCGVLHAVRPVTAGARYAFLPFVYDAAGQAIRDAELARAGLA